ncbi:DNA nucleotidylexotransferase-like isoform X2 [Xyrauchen texanus]|uniref:DNA nucleotidylexotransferase-like isoform X2 n=1 Tax=Xyrauchen texanus TaxID=154827 RepID=UPI0022425158|nr:DNA nucleotidylexotransferase-like isoform X2 [Xyrauchen texanus]
MFQTAFLTRKRRRPDINFTQVHEEVKFRDVTLYLVEKRMGKSRRNFLTNLARSKGFLVENMLSGHVTHVVSEGNAPQDLWNWLEEQNLREPHNKHVLNISWFTESMSAGEPVPLEMRHYILNPAAEQKLSLCPSSNVMSTVSPYACQRRTTIENHNKVFTEIFECGASLKAQEILRDERYRTMKLFSSVFGVGPKTAENWYCRGLRTFEDVLTEPMIKLNRMQTAGFMFYEDISKPVSRPEANALKTIVEEAVTCVNSSASVNVIGGFRRGKEFGHDVDFIIRAPEPGQEDGLLPAVIDRFKSQNILLYSDFHESTFDLRLLPSRRFEAMDHFQKCFLILKLKRDQVTDIRGSDEVRKHGQCRDWRAVRVDLVAPPIERYAYALLGWTGSTLFERDLRRFARLERGKLLDNHALYDKATNTFLPADTEEDIFAHLGLEYIEPLQRNA